jgi:hypothetical protein
MGLFSLVLSLALRFMQKKPSWTVGRSKVNRGGGGEVEKLDFIINEFALEPKTYEEEVGLYEKNKSPCPTE